MQSTLWLIIIRCSEGRCRLLCPVQQASHPAPSTSARMWRNSVLQELLEPYSRRLANYCSPKLLPLLDLPRVKVGRARQVQGAGFTGVGDIARILINLIRLLARCQDMVNNYTDMANEWRLPKLVSSCS